MTWLRYAVVAFGCLVCLSPVMAVYMSERFARRHGCVVHEGFSSPCIVNGVDYGDRLHAAFVSGWLMLVTLPVAGILTLVLMVMIVIDLVRCLAKK